MKYKLFVFSEVTRELGDIALFLETRRSGYAELFISSYAQTLTYLVQHPLAQALQQDGYRQVKIGRFVYYLLYEINGNRIEVYQVIHASRDTTKKKRKK